MLRGRMRNIYRTWRSIAQEFTNSIWNQNKNSHNLWNSYIQEQPSHPWIILIELRQPKSMLRSFLDFKIRKLNWTNYQIEKRKEQGRRICCKIIQRIRRWRLITSLEITFRFHREDSWRRSLRFSLSRTSLQLPGCEPLRNRKKISLFQITSTILRAINTTRRSSMSLKQWISSCQTADSLSRCRQAYIHRGRTASWPIASSKNKSNSQNLHSTSSWHHLTTTSPSSTDPKNQERGRSSRSQQGTSAHKKSTRGSTQEPSRGRTLHSLIGITSWLSILWIHEQHVSSKWWKSGIRP